MLRQNYGDLLRNSGISTGFKTHFCKPFYDKFYFNWSFNKNKLYSVLIILSTCEHY